MTSSSARTLLDTSLVWDNHGCMPLRPFDESFLPQLSRYKAAGVKVVSLNIGYGEQGIEQHIRMAAALRQWVSLHQEQFVLVGTMAEIERASAEAKLGIFFDIEGMNAVADQLSMIQLYYDLGVRWMLVAYNRHNPAGGGCQQDDDPGLTAFGRKVLDEMARVGMIACCSHTGYRTTMDVMSYSSRPVIFSHSNARAVFDHPRNVQDDALKACAATGGVVGINGISLFLGKGKSMVDQFIRHLDYVVQLIGPAHAGIGLDYVFDMDELGDMTTNAATFPPELGYNQPISIVPPEALEEIIGNLLRMGYSERDLRGILGANFARVANAVWRPSQ
jgi:membrane dipeptidase